jgi:hypothetical protein
MPGREMAPLIVISPAAAMGLTSWSLISTGCRRAMRIEKKIMPVIKQTIRNTAIISDIFSRIPVIAFPLSCIVMACAVVEF